MLTTLASISHRPWSGNWRQEKCYLADGLYRLEFADGEGQFANLSLATARLSQQLFDLFAMSFELIELAVEASYEVRIAYVVALPLGGIPFFGCVEPRGGLRSFVRESSVD